MQQIQQDQKQIVYYKLQEHAIAYLNSKINDKTLSQETHNFVIQYLLSINIQGKKSLYNETITKIIYSGKCNKLLSRNIETLSMQEKIIFENEKKQIENIIEENIKKNTIEEKNVQSKYNEVSTTKPLTINTLEKENGEKIITFQDEKGDTTIRQDVGNQNVAEIIGIKDKYYTDTSSFDVNNLSSEQVKKKLQEGITNDNTTYINAHAENINNEDKQNINILQDAKLSGTYDMTNHVAITDEGKIIDINKNNDQSIKMLEPNNINTPIDNDKTIYELFDYVQELSERKDISYEDKKSLLEAIPRYKKLSDENKNEFLKYIAPVDEKIISNENKNKTLTKNLEYKQAGKASSIVIAFISGIITGVVIMLLIYFFLTH